MEVIQIQGKGPLLDIHKIYHVHKQQQKKSSILNNQNITVPSVLYDLVLEKNHRD